MHRILLALAFISLPTTSFCMTKQQTIQTVITAQIKKLQASPGLAAQHRTYIQQHCSSTNDAVTYIQKVLFDMITTNFITMSALRLCDIPEADLPEPIMQNIKEELANEEQESSAEEAQQGESSGKGA